MSGVLTDLRVVVFFYRLGTICLKLPHTHLLLSFACCFWCFVFLEHHGTSLIDWPLPIAHPKTKAANACESCEPGAWSSQVRFRTLHLTVCSATFHQRRCCERLAPHGPSSEFKCSIIIFTSFKLNMFHLI